jgi:cysteine synthase A
MSILTCLHESKCVGVCRGAMSELVQIQTDSNPVIAKLEFVGGRTASIKDRVVDYMIDKAIDSGELSEKGTVVEATSGSTGIAAAVSCKRRGLSFVTVLPASVSREKVHIIKLLGGEAILVESGGIAAAQEKAAKLALENGWFCMNQFGNPNHWKAHHVTAAELVHQLGVQSNRFTLCIGVGTGATLTGIYDYCVNHEIDLRPVVARLNANATRLKDFGFAPVGLDNLYERRRAHDPRFRNLVEEIEVDESEAESAFDRLLSSGYPIGPASAVNFAVASQLAASSDSHGPVVTIFTDRMERYLANILSASSDI